jgi:hypothetical protein
MALAQTPPAVYAVVSRMQRRGFTLLAIGAVVGGCLSPTIPLPPPDEPTITPTSEPNTVRLTGRNATAGAFIVVFNESPGVPLSERVSGAQIDGSGNWSCTMRYGTLGEVATLYQEIGEERSNPRQFVVRLTR